MGTSGRTRSVPDGTVIVDVQFGRPTRPKPWNALRDAEGEGVWNTKGTKGGERRERVSWISRPFAFFVLQSFGRPRGHRRSSPVPVNLREGLPHWTLAVRVDVLWTGPTFANSFPCLTGRLLPMPSSEIDARHIAPTGLTGYNGVVRE